MNIKAPESGYKRAWRYCAKHDRFGYYDYVPFSMSNPISIMPCGCDTRACETATEEQAHAAIGHVESDQPPVAWMLRATRARHTRSAAQHGETRVLCGSVFMTEATALAAAARMTNKWRRVEAFPVYASPMTAPPAAPAPQIDATPDPLPIDRQLLDDITGGSFTFKPKAKRERLGMIARFRAQILKHAEAEQ